ncbi:MAG: hypothetical protein ACREUE_14825 [Panacagrimonas sp.]
MLLAVLGGLGAGCSDANPVGEGTYPVELFLGVGERQSAVSLDECTSVQLGAYVRFDGDAPQIGDYAALATFTSSDPTTVFVSDGVTSSPDGEYFQRGGLIALKKGLATISATYLSFRATLVVQVTELSGLRIEPVLTDIAEDLPQKFDLIATFSEARPEQDASDTASWSFEPGTARAAVDTGGEVQANSARDDQALTLIARLPECGRTATRTFRVSPIQSVSMEYEFPEDVRLPLGMSERLRLYAHFAAAGATVQNISRSAEVDNVPDDYITADVKTNTPPTNISELVNAVDIGDDLVLVQALTEDEGREGGAAFDIHIESGPGFDLRTRTWDLIETRVDDLRIEPEELVIRYPDRRRLSAIAHFSNGMERDISREVNWTSLDSTSLAVSSEVDDAGTVEVANVDLDAEVEAFIEQDGAQISDRALVHIFSSLGSTPSSDP